MQRLAMAALVLLLLLGVPVAARADTALTPEEQVLMRLFGTDPITPDMFAPALLAQMSMPEVQATFAKARATVGPPLSVEQHGTRYIVHTASYQVPVDISLDRDGRIAALLFHPIVPNFGSPDDVLKAIAALPGRTSYLITRNGEVLYAEGQSAPMAVSLGFKLGVLAVVADEIAAGRLHWDTVVRLTPGEVSLPPGVLQTMPVGSPLTVHTLAAFMMAQSDATGTDMLMDLVGRDKVAAKLGAAFALKTVEFFKLNADPALRLRFAAADAAGKLQIVSGMVSAPLPAAADTGPFNPGVEWYLPASRLCSLIREVEGLDVFEINPGVASRAAWSRIAFNGGSDVGVDSLTSALTDKAGNSYCVAMIWNDSKPLDAVRFASLHGILISKLAAP